MFFLFFQGGGRNFKKKFKENGHNFLFHQLTDMEYMVIYLEPMKDQEEEYL